MSMTREEAAHILEYSRIVSENFTQEAVTATYVMALAALRGPTREQVEKMRGEWIIEDAGDGDRRKKCSLCDQPISGWWGRDRFCANCGSPMTDEAVEMVMERLEALHSETKTD